MEETKLLCTFTDRKNLEKTLQSIQSVYNVVNSKIIVVRNVDDEDDIFCFYNIDKIKHQIKEKTISIHRRKHTNTLYTINALNQLIQLMYGKENHDYEIN